MNVEQRKLALTGKLNPTGKCVDCGAPTSPTNRFLCRKHEIENLQPFIDFLNTFPAIASEYLKSKIRKEVNNET
jgi:hypothetical protein